MVNKEKTSKQSWIASFWPFERYELKKLLPLILMKFFVSINFGILYSLKDTLIVTTKGSGAEVIPVLKGGIVLPVVIVFSLLYSKLSTVLSKQRLFYTFMIGFTVTFFISGFILFPNSDALSPHKFSDSLESFFNGKHTHWIAVIRNWIPSLIYVTAELWSSLVIFVMFWGFANQITTVAEAKKSYTIYIAAGNLAPMIVGPLTAYIAMSVKGAGLPFYVSVQVQSFLLIMTCIAIMTTYWWSNKYVLSDARFAFPDEIRPTKKKTSLKDGLLHIMRSPYLRHIAVLVIGYSFAFNLVEVTWKAHLKLMYPTSEAYQGIMGSNLFFIGVISFLLSIFVSSGLMRKYGWHLTAQLTPIAMGVTGIAFFCLVVFQDSLRPMLSYFNLTPLYLIVMFGFLQSVIAKVCKYSFFDPTKEILFIPLDPVEKTKGKAAVDAVGSRLGKSGSSWIQVILMDVLGTSAMGIAPLLLPLVIVMVFIWGNSARKLSVFFQEKQSTRAV